MADTVIIYKGIGVVPGSVTLSGNAGDVFTGAGTCVSAPAGAWGGITGTLSNQTDLQTALNGKQASGSYATAAQGALADSALQSIADGSVTLAKQANMATASVVYRKTAGAGAPEVNPLATLKTDLGLTGTNSGDQTIQLTGGVTGSGTGSFAATVITNANLSGDVSSSGNTTTIGAGKVTDAMQVDTSAATSATTGTMTVNMTTAVITITPTGACTFNASGGRTGQIVTFSITTSGTTSFVLTFGTNFRKTGTLATGTVSARFFTVTFRCLNGTTWTEMCRTAVQT